MSDNVRLIRIFIASPSGLDEERQAAHRMTDEINRQSSDYWRCKLELIGWEETLPGFSRPQALINQDLDKCDYFIGVIWDRWGSPPTAGDGRYTSGFEEEFHRARDHVIAGRMKDIALFFKEISEKQKTDPGQSAQKVLKFRADCIDSREFLFREFKSISDFEKLIRDTLMRVGWQEANASSPVPPAPKRLDDQPNLPSEPIAAASPEDGLFDAESRGFTQELLNRPRDYDTTTAYEIARLRLVASAIERNGNDNTYLGNHDANLLFEKRHDWIFSQQEIRALVTTGVVGTDHHNRPLWHWLTKTNNGKDYFHHVRFLAYAGKITEKQRAIQILRVAGQSTSSISELYSKEKLFHIWFSRETPELEFNAATLFLADNGEFCDIHLLEEALHRLPIARAHQIKSAMVRIICRSRGASAALTKLIELDAEQLGEDVAKELFSHRSEIRTEELRPLLRARPDSVRRKAAEELKDRGELTIVEATALVTDSDHYIRLLGAEALRDLDAELDEEILRKALTIVKPTQYRGILSAIGGNNTDEIHYIEYRKNRFREMNFEALYEYVNKCRMRDRAAVFVLYEKYGSRLRTAIKKGISEEFSRLATPGVSEYSEKTVKEYVKMSSIALCKQKKPEDIETIRCAIDDFDIEMSIEILDFIGKFGDWGDVERITKNHQRQTGALSMLQLLSIDLPRERAQALLSIGNERIADVLALEMDAALRRSVALAISQVQFARLTDQALVQEMKRRDNEYRSIVALRCCQALSKSRLNKILDCYFIERENIYYNSIHWLDLGASLPRDIAKNIAVRELHSYEDMLWK